MQIHNRELITPALPKDFDYEGAKYKDLAELAREKGFLPTTVIARYRQWGSIEKAVGVELKENMRRR